MASEVLIDWWEAFIVAEQWTGVTAQTKVIAILGSPIAQAMSPSLHNASFDYLGIDCVCVAADVQPDQVSDALGGARALGFAGLIVTMPDKNAVIEHLDHLSPAARLMGAVNVITREGDEFTGHNTDGAGFMRAVKEAGVAVVGKKMTLIGAGGAGSAIYTQAALDGVAEIAVFNMKDAFFEQTKDRLNRVADETGTKLTLHDLADRSLLANQVAESVLVADATRVGMAPLDQESNIAKEWLQPGQAVVDTVYVPRQTKLLQLAAEVGAQPISGLGMLLWQAALAEELWFDVQMPVEHIQGLFFPSSV